MSVPGWDEAPHMSALDAASSAARNIADLWWLFFWVAVLVWALVMATSAYAILRRRQARDDGPDPSPGAERASVIVTGGAAAATLLILFALLIASARTSQALALRPPADALKIEVTGQRWWWLVEYPSDVPSQRVTTANELHVPVGRPVTLALQSRDVIHSFWVPELHGKRDLIPGNLNELHFTVERPGVYRGQCAEFCGLQHANMGLLVVAEPPERFQAWLEAQRAPAASASSSGVDASVTDGERVFLGASCPVCHSVRGTAAAGSVGPDLTHLMSRRMLGAATRPNDRGELAHWVLDPHDAKLGTLMPPNPLPPERLEPLLSYLTSLR